MGSWKRRRPPDWINNTAEKMARSTASGFFVVTCSWEPSGLEGSLEHHFPDSNRYQLGSSLFWTYPRFRFCRWLITFGPPKIGGFGCERMRNMTKWAHNSIPFLSDSNLQEYHWLFSFVWLCVIILVDLDMNDFIISNVEQVEESSVKSGSKAGQAGLQKDEDYAKIWWLCNHMQPTYGGFGGGSLLGLPQ